MNAPLEYIAINVNDRKHSCHILQQHTTVCTVHVSLLAGDGSQEQHSKENKPVWHSTTSYKVFHDGRPLQANMPHSHQDDYKDKNQTQNPTSCHSLKDATIQHHTTIQPNTRTWWRNTTEGAAAAPSYSSYPGML